MRNITIKAYCNLLERDVTATMPILGDYPDDYTVGIASGCIHQVKFGCDTKKCPLGQEGNKVRDKLNKRSKF